MTSGPAPRATTASTILVVDAEEILRRVVKAVLEQNGFRVLSAASGAEAFDVLSHHGAEVCAMILDLEMPGMGTPEILDRVHASWEHVPVILATGYGEQEARSRVPGREIAGFLSKPFEFAELVDKLRALCGC